MVRKSVIKTSPFAQYLGLPRKVPAVAQSVKRVVSNAATRAAKAAIQSRPAKAVAKAAHATLPASKPAFHSLSTPVPQAAIEAKRTTVRQVRGEERARCKQIMDAALKAGNPKVGLQILKTDMRAADAVRLIQLLNLDTAALCARWSKGQVIGANE
jgi:hypothetical protein